MNQKFNAQDRLVNSDDAVICVHNVGLSPGFWCGGCLNAAWRREFAPDSTLDCVGEGCMMSGPCSVHVSV